MRKKDQEPILYRFHLAVIFFASVVLMQPKGSLHDAWSDWVKAQVEEIRKEEIVENTKQDLQKEDQIEKNQEKLAKK